MKLLAKIIRIVSITTISGMTACGGGSGGSVGDNNPLSKYVGTYYICDSNNHTKATATITINDSNSVSASIAQDVYLNSNCSGELVGSYRWSKPFTVTYTSQTVANFPHVTIMPLSDTVDGVTISHPDMIATLSGPGVIGSCVNFTNGNTCFNSISSPADSITGAWYTRGNYVVFFYLSNGTLVENSILSKDSAFAYSMLIPN